MPELPGPPEDASDEYRQAWLEGAATVAQLQADQWAILAGRYREAAADIDGDAGGEAAGETTLDSPTDDGDGEDEPRTCPDCEIELVEGLGGTAVCPHCGTSPSD